MPGFSANVYQWAFRGGERHGFSAFASFLVGGVERSSSPHQWVITWATEGPPAPERGGGGAGFVSAEQEREKGLDCSFPLSVSTN